MKRLALLATFLLVALGGSSVAALADTSGGSGSPAQQCRAEQAQDPAAFQTRYGTSGNGANAFGKCVSMKARAQSTSTSTTSSTATTTTTTTSANPKFAAECRTERAADPAAFKAKYGTNKNKSNAFGKCVAAMAKHHGK